MRRTLARALGSGGEWGEIYLERRESTNVSLEEGRVTRASHVVERGAGVRAVAGGRYGYASTEDLSPRALLGAAEAASRVSGPGGAGSGPPPRSRPRVFRTAPVADLSPVSEPFEAAPMARRVDLVTALDVRVRALEPRVTHVTVSLGDELSEVAIARSDGRVVEDRRPRVGLRVTCVGQDGTRREQATVGYGARVGAEALSSALVERLSARLVEQLRALFEARRPPAGEFPVVLDAGSSGILLHEAIGHGLEADFNRKGTSIFAGRMNSVIASPDVTLIDTGLIPNQHGALNVDDEGEPGAATVLVERGVLRSYLHDGISAAHYGVVPTGSARRESFRHPPFPRMRCTCLQAGPRPRDEIIRSVRRGLLASAFGNGQVQIGAGDFSFYVRLGWWIEDGRLAYPVKDVNLIGNGPRVLAAIDLVGDDLRVDDGTWTCGKAGQSVPVGMGMPTVRVPALTIGGVS